MDRKKAGSMSACQRSEKKCGITWDKVEMGRTKDTKLLGIDSRGCMAQSSSAGIRSFSATLVSSGLR